MSILILYPSCYLTINSLLFLVLSSTYTFSQTKGYIFTKESRTSGGKVYFDQSSPTLVKYQRYELGNPTSYTAEQLDGFGYKDPELENGLIYLSRKVLYQGKTQPVFLKLLFKNDNLKLFSLSKKRFFLEKEEVLQEMTEKDYLDLMKENQVVCTEKEWQYNMIKFRENNLKAAFNKKKQGKCQNILVRGLGIKVGLLNTTLDVNATAFAGNNTDNAFQLEGSGYEIGLFYREPFWQLPNITWHTELSLQKLSFQQSFMSENELALLFHDLKTDFTQVQSKFGLTYEFKLDRLRPIFGINGILNYNIGQQNDYSLAKSNFDSNLVELTNTQDITWQTSLYYGIGVNVGAVFYYGNKGRIFKVQAEADLLANGENEFQQMKQFKITLASTVL